MSASRLLICGAALLLLAGCATVSREQMITETKGYSLPEIIQEGNPNGLVYVVRPEAVGGMIRFNLFVDNPKDDAMEAGFTKGHQYIWFYLPPGEHTLYSKAENQATLTLTVEAGKLYFVQQVAKMGVIMARNELFVIDSVAGMYYVKDGKPGTMKKTTFP